MTSAYGEGKAAAVLGYPNMNPYRRDIKARADIEKRMPRVYEYANDYDSGYNWGMIERKKPSVLFVDTDTISEYGLTQRLPFQIRVF